MERRHQDDFCKDNRLATTRQKPVMPMDAVILRPPCLQQRVSLGADLILTGILLSIPLASQIKSNINIL